jgi:hypothetical protein
MSKKSKEVERLEKGVAPMKMAKMTPSGKAALAEKTLARKEAELHQKESKLKEIKAVNRALKAAQKESSASLIQKVDTLEGTSENLLQKVDAVAMDIGRIAATQENLQQLFAQQLQPKPPQMAVGPPSPLLLPPASPFSAFSEASLELSEADDEAPPPPPPPRLLSPQNDEHQKPVEKKKKRKATASKDLVKTPILFMRALLNDVCLCL